MRNVSMADILVQNITSHQNLDTDNNPRKVKAISYKDYFDKEKTFDFQQYPLSKCGFLNGKNGEIKFIKGNILESLKISPTVNGEFVEGDLSKQIVSLSNWERLYIELFGCKYIVARSCRSEKIRILGGEDDLNSGVNFEIITFDNEKSITPIHFRKIRQSQFLSIEGNSIKIWQHESSQFSPREKENLKWRIPILYIIAHASVRRIEKIIDEMRTEKKSKHKLYEDFLNFRLNELRSNPVVIERTATANEIWCFFYDYYKVEKNVEELNAIINDYQNELKELENKKIEKRMYKFTVLALLITFFSLISVINDGCELYDKIMKTDVAKAIVTYFIPCSL